LTETAVATIILSDFRGFLQFPRNIYANKAFATTTAMSTALVVRHFDDANNDVNTDAKYH